MSAETKALVRRGIKWEVAGSVVGITAMVAFVVANYYGSIPWTPLLAIGVFLVPGFWINTQAKRIKQQLEAQFGSSSAPVERLRMADQGGNFVFNLFMAFALPFLFLSPTSNAPNGWNVLLSLPFWGTVAVVYLVRFLRSQQRYWRLLPAHELRPLLDKHIQGMRIIIPMYILLIALQTYNNANVFPIAFGDAVFPPQTAADWMAMLSWLAPFLLIGSIVVQLWRYRQARRLLNREVRV